MTSLDGISIKTTRSNRLKFRLHTSNNLIWVSDLVSFVRMREEGKLQKKVFCKRDSKNFVETENSSFRILVSLWIVWTVIITFFYDNSAIESIMKTKQPTVSTICAL